MSDEFVCSICGGSVYQEQRYTGPWRHGEILLMCAGAFPTTREIWERAMRKRHDLKLKANLGTQAKGK
jgi:hypothetical protein